MVMPQSSANTIRSTWTRPRSSSEISVTLALWPRKLEQVIPRARPSGSGVPQSGVLGRELERAQRARVVRRAARGAGRRGRGRRRSRARRSPTRARTRCASCRPIARPSSGLRDSKLVDSSLKFSNGVRRVDGTGRREEVDAVREHHVADERQVHRRRLGDDLLVAGGQAAVRVGSGAHAVDGHRAVAAALEFLLAQRLDLDRVLPVERSRDLHGLGRRVVLGAASAGRTIRRRR